MKKILILATFFSFVGVVKGKILENHIECPPGLSIYKDDTFGKFNIKIAKPMDQELDYLTEAHIFHDTLFNGIPVSVGGMINFEEATKSEVLHQHLKNTIDAHELNPKETSTGLLKDGILSCTFKGGHKGEKLLDVVVDTKGLGLIYQCPLPKDITVIDKQETSSVLVKAIPRCKGMSAAECKEYAVQIYVDRSDLKPAPGNPGKFHLYVTPEIDFSPPSGVKSIPFTAEERRKRVLPQPYADSTTSSQAEPMIFETVKRNGSDRVDTYQFTGKYGDISLESSSAQKNLRSDNGIQVTDHEKVGPVNYGFGVDAQNRAVDKNGNFVIPDCRATKIKRVGGRTLIQCYYAHNTRDEHNIVLEGDITHDINLAKCTMFGGSKGKAGFEPLREMTGDSKDKIELLSKKLKDGDSLSVSSLKAAKAKMKNGNLIARRVQEHIPPPFMICTK